MIRRMPGEMLTAPVLDEHWEPSQVVPNFALLINPFYTKDPHASFGKHVLTPTLALTSIAAGTPDQLGSCVLGRKLITRPPSKRSFSTCRGDHGSFDFRRTSF